MQAAAEVRMTIWKRVVQGSFGAVAIFAFFGFSQPQGGSVFLNIDHVSVCGSDLETMRQAFAAVGLTTDYGGPHATDGTHMALVGFDDGSYIELIAPERAGQGNGSGWGKLMADNAGRAPGRSNPKTSGMKRRG